MNFRRKLFIVWCSFSVLLLLWAIASDGSLIFLKFRVGGWRATYVHFTITVLIAVAPLAALLLGRIVLWAANRIGTPPN